MEPRAAVAGNKGASSPHEHNSRLDISRSHFTIIERKMNLSLKTRTFPLSEPSLMGIVNITPDSFSDGGRFFDQNRALEHALQLVEQGADLIDIGGESTRPGSQPVSPEEESRRTVPLVSALCEQLDRRFSEISARESRIRRPVVSIDTSKALVARETLAAGAEMINDISSLQFDPEMIEVLQESGAAICIMHIKGIPKTMQDQPHYEGDDPVPEVFGFFEERINFLRQQGIPRDKIILDPGLGFGKNFTHNVKLVHEIATFHRFGLPLLVGHSRKRFLAEMIGDSSRDRTSATLATSLFLHDQGVQILRVHDVAAHHDALLTWRALHRD